MSLLYMYVFFWQQSQKIGFVRETFHVHISFLSCFRAVTTMFGSRPTSWTDFRARFTSIKGNTSHPEWVELETVLK